MTCCSSCDKDTSKSNIFFYEFENFLEKHKEGGVEKLKKITPAILALKKFVDAEEKFNKDKIEDKNSSLYQLVKLFDNPAEENIEALINVIEDDDISISFFVRLYSELYKHLERKNTFVKIENGEIVARTEESQNIFSFTQEQVQARKEEIIKGRKDQNKAEDSEEDVSIADLLNQHFIKEKVFIARNANYLVVHLVGPLEEWTDGLVIKKDKLVKFDGLLSGWAILKYICCFSSMDEYDEDRDIYSKNVSTIVKDLDFKKLKENPDSSCVVLFEVAKVNDKKIKNLEEDNE
ncbi:MAG: hypothetical protein LBD32_01105 [Cytophagales bacterium]|jgi:hypothetical protein|nr:hypothetical protein [Cytophagales bacterium]